MDQNGPPISLTVLLSSYNYSRYILEALERITPQLGPGMELIIIDDASTDDTLEFIAPVVSANPAIRLIRNERNEGIHRVLNRGLALARGKYFICTAADDHIRPGLLRKSLDLMLRHPEAAICTAPSLQMDAQGLVSNGWVGPKLPDQAYNGPEQALALMRRFGFWFTGATTMFRTDILREHEGFSLELGNLADSFVSQRMALEHGFCTLSEPLGVVRILAQSYSCAERYDMEKTHALRLVAIARMEKNPEFFPPDFVREWVDVWGFLDALKAWHRTTLWAQKGFLGEGLRLFRHEPTALDRIMACVVRCIGVTQFLVFAFWGLLVLGRYRLFWQYIRLGRLVPWMLKQLRMRQREA